jgi:hypothetical protein
MNNIVYLGGYLGGFFGTFNINHKYTRLQYYKRKETYCAGAFYGSLAANIPMSLFWPLFIIPTGYKFVKLLNENKK